MNEIAASLTDPPLRRQSPGVFRYTKRGVRYWGFRYFDIDGRFRPVRAALLSKMLARQALSRRQQDVDVARSRGMKSVDELIQPKSTSTVKLRDFVKRYKEVRASGWRPYTKEVYESFLKNHILPKLGDRPLNQITPGILHSFKTGRLASGAAKATVVKDFMILSGLFAVARDDGFISENPVRLVRIQKTLKVRNKITRWVDDAEEAAILKHAPAPLRSAIIVAIHSGLREQEECQLSWADVNFERRVITVRDTKNGEDREVPMNATLVKALQRQPTRFKSTFIFINERTDEPYKCFNNTAWRKALRAAGIKNLRWHDLRHTFGSRLRQRGVPLETIAELMGHKDLKMTLRYAHLDQTDRMKAVRLLDKRSAAPPSPAQPKAAN